MAHTEPDQAPTPIVIVGHVDHGKSTLIGRLLHDTGNLPEGVEEAVRASSAKRGLKIEWAFLLDSLQTERDQGVTIDSTRIPFALDGRAFVIVDAPGHRQFLRNMVTGTADADAAVLVVDIAEGAQEQTRRHAVLLRLLGVRQVIVALNKADLVGFEEERVASASRAVKVLLNRLEIDPAAIIPISARFGDNLATRSERAPWYRGPTLVEALAAVRPRAPHAEQALRLPVQDVYRQDERRLVVGRIEAGRVRVGDAVTVAPHGVQARIAAIESWHTQPQIAARAGQSVALVLEPDVVVARGDLLHAPSQPPLRAARLKSRLFWLRQEPLRVGEAFHLRVATADYPVTVASIDSVLRIADLVEETSDHVPPEGFAEITLAAPDGVLFDSFEPGNRAGRGVLVDSGQHIVGGAPLIGPAATVAATPSLFPERSAISSWERAQAKGHRGFVFWLTGLSGAGKTAVARATEMLLFHQGIDVVVLDGDTLRARLSPDLGFSPEARSENVRRAAVVAQLMAENGTVVLAAFISPRVADRELARRVVGEGFHEIFVRARHETCEQRDPKGLYAAARAGKIASFTAVDAPYENPQVPDLVIDTDQDSVPTAAERLATHITGVVALAQPAARNVRPGGKS